MFKSKEELIKEAYPEGMPQEDVSCDMYVSYVGAIGEAFASIRERIDFYKRYRVTNEDTGKISFQAGYDRLRKEKKEIFKLCKHIKTKQEYNIWLFNYCFDGVK